MTRDTSMISTENSPSRSVELRFDPLKNRPTFGVRSAARLFPSRPFAFAAINGLPPLLSHPLRNNGSRNSNSCLNRKNLHTCSLSSLLFSSLLSSSIPFYSIPFHSILLSSHRRRMPECHRWPIFDRFFSHFQPQRQPQVGRLVIRFDLRPSSYLRHLDPGSAFSYLICVFVRGESRKMPAAVLAMQLFSSSSSSLSLSLSSPLYLLELRQRSKSIGPAAKPDSRRDDRAERCLSANRIASILCHGTRCRTLCITRGKENVETARDTRHEARLHHGLQSVHRRALHYICVCICT